MEEKAIELLENLATQLGIAVPYLWEVLVRQAFVEAVSCGLYLSVSVIILLICSYFFIFLLDTKDKKFQWLTSWVFWIGLFSFIVAIYNLIKSMWIIPAGLFNPEYWALQKIMNML